MGHYAKVKDGVVENVIVADYDYIQSLGSEAGVQYVKTSYNTKGGVHYVPNTSFETVSPDQSKSLRKNFAIPGMTYDSERDAFYETQPYPSWTLNEETCVWEPPVACESDALLADNQYYEWNESMLRWDTITVDLEE